MKARERPAACGGFPTVRSAALAVLCVSAVAIVLWAANTPLPMRRLRAPGTAARVYPVRVDDPSVFRRFNAGGVLVVESAMPPGCLIVRGEGSFVVCNTDLFCAPNRSQPTVFSVYAMPSAPDRLLIESGSGCDSTCCDNAAAVISIRGKRLDDNVGERLLGRVLVAPCVLAGVVGGKFWHSMARRSESSVLGAQCGWIASVLLVGMLSVAISLVTWG